MPSVAGRREEEISAVEVGTPDALEELAARLDDAGGEVQRPDTDELPGWRRLHVLDPWGNRLELLARERAGSAPA